MKALRIQCHLQISQFILTLKPGPPSLRAVGPASWKPGGKPYSPTRRLGPTNRRRALKLGQDSLHSVPIGLW